MQELKRIYALFLIFWYTGLSTSFLVAGLGFLPINLTIELTGCFAGRNKDE